MIKTPWYRDGFWWAVISAEIFGVIAVFTAAQTTPGISTPMLLLFLSNVQLIGALTILKRRVSSLEILLTDEGPAGRIKRRQAGLSEINPFQTTY